MHSADIVPFRPPALPAIGYRVDVHDFGYVVVVILFQHRVIASQNTFDTTVEAEPYARELAEDHGCSVVHHNYRHLIMEVPNA